MDRLTHWEREMLKKEREKDPAPSGYELERRQFSCNSHVHAPEEPTPFPFENDIQRYFDDKKKKEGMISPNAEIVKAGLKETESDPMVAHPEHYLKGGIETVDFILAKGLDFLTGSAVKYISRAAFKGNEIQDLKKAVFNLQLKIAQLEKKNE